MTLQIMCYYFRYLFTCHRYIRIWQKTLKISFLFSFISAQHGISVPEHPRNFLQRRSSASRQETPSVKQLEFLSTAKTWYIDVTFKKVNKPFYQNSTLNSWICEVGRRHEATSTTLKKNSGNLYMYIIDVVKLFQLLEERTIHLKL